MEKKCDWKEKIFFENEHILDPIYLPVIFSKTSLKKGLRYFFLNFSEFFWSFPDELFMKSRRGYLVFSIGSEQKMQSTLNT